MISIGPWCHGDSRADQQLTTLVECWAHQGPAKVAQKSKLVTDAVKLHWVAQSLSPAPDLGSADELPA
ncbi:hypothetical protein GCM10022275_19710 [Tessaracoccus defluvii]